MLRKEATTNSANLRHSMALALPNLVGSIELMFYWETLLCNLDSNHALLYKQMVFVLNKSGPAVPTMETRQIPKQVKGSQDFFAVGFGDSVPIDICIHHHRPTKEAMFLFTQIHRQIACMHIDVQISFFGKHVIC